MVSKLITIFWALIVYLGMMEKELINDSVFEALGLEDARKVTNTINDIRFRFDTVLFIALIIMWFILYRMDRKHRKA